MNKENFEPVAALQMEDGTELHSSSRTAMSTNTDPCGTRVLSVATSSLALQVVGGELVVRFQRHVMNGPARLPIARGRRTPTRR